MAIGRISGPLLKANLVRNGIDLAFETDLLYLDVNNNRVGIKTASPQHELDVNGTTRTTNLIVTNRADIGSINIEGNTISSDVEYLNLGTFDNVIYQNKLRVDSINIEGNVISTNDSNADLELRPNGTGSVEVYADMNVTGNIHATGNISADGSITLGNEDTDDVVFNAKVASNIIPNIDIEYTLGTSDKRWNDIWVRNIVTDSVNSEELSVDGIDLTLRQGKIWYVATNGDNDRFGNHPQDPYATLKKALSVAQAGDTVYLYPGVYEEAFPLEIPVGVAVKGTGIRSVKIVPTTATQNNDVFLLNGETTIEDLTIADFYSPGYAFKFATGFTVTSRSPYIKNLSVITKGTVITAEDPRGYNSADAGKGAYLDGSVATANSNEASCLFHSVTFITPGVDAIELTNGVRVEWLNCFTYFANRSIFAQDGAVGLKGTGETALQVAGLSGSIAAGETVSYFDTDGITLLASATISSVDSTGKVFLSGKQTAFETATGRGGKIIQAFGDAKLSTAVKKFGSASLALDGDGDYAFVQSNADFAFGTGDFTIEGWIYRVGSGITQQIIDVRAAALPTVSATLQINASNVLTYVAAGNTRITGTIVTANAWHHIAVSRQGNSTKLFFNGTQVGSTYTDTNNYVQSPVYIGSRPDGALNFNGYIDDLRIIKGTAVYTANFTPPATRVPVTPNTVLMARFDGENNSTTFLDDVVYDQDVRFSGGATANRITLTDFTDFGAEVRLIGSASVYGNFGLVGDGPGVIMYAIGQNLAYIGNGKEVSNDPTTVIQDNEVVESNGARIRYDSVDHKGDFRVGDLFYVNQEDGSVNFSVSDFTIDTTDGVTFVTDGQTTFIDGTKIETGNWRISGNTVETLTGDANIAAASGNVIVESNVNINGSLDVTGNVTIGGNITIGDEETDTIQIIAGIDSDIIPRLNSVYSLGTPDKVWSTLYTNEVSLDNIRIRDNFIETTDSNSDLELRASGTGKILIPDNDVLIENNLTVNATTTLNGNTTVFGDIEIVGAIVQNGSYSITLDVSVGQNLTVGAAAQFEEILIDDNFITTTTSNTDLELRANGTGKILIPNNDVVIENNLTVKENIFVKNIEVGDTVTADKFSTGDILISNNYITTTQSNSDLELRASGTGKILIPNNDVLLVENFTVKGDAYLKDTVVIGQFSHTGNATQVGNIDLTGNLNIDGTITISSAAQFENILIDDNVITTTLSNSNLEIRATEFGKVIIPDNDVEITKNLLVIGNINAANLTVNNLVTADSFKTSDILIDDNVITTTLINSDLILRANGSGKILVPNNDVIIENNLTVEGSTAVKDIVIEGTVSHIGNTNQIGNFDLNGDLFVTGEINVSASVIQFEDIQISGNRIATTLSNSDLELKANGDGKIVVPDNDVEISNNLIVANTITSQNLTVNATVTADKFSTGDILIEENVIATTNSNSNLELRTSGTGSVIIDSFRITDSTISSDDNITLTPANGSVNIIGSGAVTIPIGTTSQRPAATAGEIRFNSELVRFEGYNGSNWVNLKGVEDLDGDTRITAELTEGSNDNIIRFYVADTEVVNVDSNRLQTQRIDAGDIRISSNIVTTVNNNQNLILQPQGTGSVVFDNISIRGNVIRNTVTDSILDFQNTGNGYVKFDGTYGVVLPSGGFGTRPPIEFSEVGQIRFNTSDNRVEVWDGKNWSSVAGSEAGITRTDAENIALDIVLTLG